MGFKHYTFPTFVMAGHRPGHPEITEKHAEARSPPFPSAFSVSPRDKLDGVATLALATKPGHDEKEKLVILWGN